MAIRMSGTQRDPRSVTNSMDDQRTQATNLAIVRKLLEQGYGQGNVKILPGLIATNYVGHLSIGDHYGPEGVRVSIDSYRAMIPNLSVTLDDVFAVGDRVARRFTFRGTTDGTSENAQAGQVQIALLGVAIDRLCGGQIVETWSRIDRLPNEP
jgi:predicted ester cyclase